MFLAILVVVELIFERAGGGTAIVNWHGMYDWMASRIWEPRSVRIIGGLCALGGLVLLGLHLIPRKKERLKVQGGDEAIDAAIDRSSVARTVWQAVGDIDGISQARVALRGNKVINSANQIRQHRLTREAA